jgi:hypothetical protein
VLAVGIFVVMSAACMARPSFNEATEELARLVEPPIKEWNPELASQADKFTEPQQCSDPFIGPSEGLRPTLTYEIPFSALQADPSSFMSAVEQFWKSEDLTLEADDSDDVLVRYAGKDGFNLRVLINFSSELAIVEGSGPCVDDPNS